MFNLFKNTNEEILLLKNEVDKLKNKLSNLEYYLSEKLNPLKFKVGDKVEYKYFTIYSFDAQKKQCIVIGVNNKIPENTYKIVEIGRDGCVMNAGESKLTKIK